MKNPFRSMFGSEPDTVKAAGDITSARELAAIINTSQNQGIGTYDYQLNIRAAYLNNPVSYYCLNLITSLATQPCWELYVNDSEVESQAQATQSNVGAIKKLIDRPNPEQTLNRFIELYLTYLYLAGEVFIERSYGSPQALNRGGVHYTILDPSKVTVNQDSYTIINTLGQVRTVAKYTNKQRNILHIANWHPFNERGMSPLTPAWLSIANLNQSQETNYAVQRNSGKVGIIAVLKSFVQTNNKPLNQEQLNGAQKDLTRFVTGKNQGKPFVISGDWDIKELGMNQKDLEFIKGMESMARNIALAFGVDPVLLSLPGDSTYNNKKEAVSMLAKLTVLPKLDAMIAELTHWMKEVVPGDWEIRVNLDEVIALEADREKLWDRQAAASDILSVDERRQMLGFEPLPNGLGSKINGLSEPKVEAEAEETAPKVDPTVEDEPLDE